MAAIAFQDCKSVVEANIIEPVYNFEIKYGQRNTRIIEFEGINLTGYTLRLIVFNKSTKYLDIVDPLKLFFTVTAVGVDPVISTVTININETDSALLPVSYENRLYYAMEDCCNQFIPSCVYELYMVGSGLEEEILSGAIQNTPTGKRAT
jgi:hypothetical protein